MGISKKVCCLGVFMGYIGGGMLVADRGEVAMGGVTEPPVVVASVADWDACLSIWGDPGIVSEAYAEFAAGGFLGESSWHKNAQVYQGSFSWCPGNELTWNYNATTGSLTHGIKSQTCANSTPARVASADGYDFLIYVFEQAPDDIVDQLAYAEIHDFVVTSSGSTFTIEFTFDSAVTYTKASATLTSGEFGSITVF